MSKRKIKINKKVKLIFIVSILMILCAFLISLYNNYQDKKFRKEIAKIQDKNVYNKDRIKATDIINEDNNIYLRLENIASILNSKYQEKNNKCSLISDNIKLELKINSNKAKLNGKEYLLKHKIVSSYDVNFISKEDIENIYNVIYDENSRIIFNKYASKILIIKTNNKNIVSKTKPIDVIDRNGLYVAKYKTIKDTQKAYTKLRKNKNTVVDIESVVKVSNEDTKNIKEITKIDEDTELSNYIKTHKSNKKVKIAVIDSGINYDLGYFDNRLLKTNINYSSSGKDAKDDFGHGTSVSSIIINTSNDNIKILPIKVINNEGESSILSLYLGIMKAIDEKVDIINISLNMRYSSDTDIIEDAIKEATNNEIQVVVSAGNNSGDVAKFAPANFKSAIVVAASNEWRMATDYTNIGKTVDYCTIGNATKNTVTILKR